MQPPPTVTATTGTGKLPHWLERTWPIFVICAAGAHCLYIAWDKWGELFIDYSRELVVPLGIAEGKQLYRDMQYHYGPLAPYLNGMLFKIFGVHLLVLVFAGLVSAGLVTVFTYRISRFWMSRRDATLVSAAFIYLCAFSKNNAHSIFNFATPYTYAATYGIAASIGSLYFLVKHIKEEQLWAFFLSVLFCAISLLCKLEIAFAAIGIHVLFLGILVYQRQVRAIHIVSWITGIAIVCGTYGLLIATSGSVTENLFSQFNQKNEKYVAEIMGVANVRQSLVDLLPSLLVQLGGVLLVVMKRRWLPNVRLWPLVFLIGALLYYPIQPWLMFRSVPFITLGMIAWLAYLWVRQSSSRTEVLPLLLVCAFALACLSRVVLNASASHYGFYLLPPALIVIGLLYFKLLPEGLQDVSLSRHEFRALGCGFFVCWIVMHQIFYFKQYAAHDVVMETPRGRLDLVEKYEGMPFGKMCLLTHQILSKFPPETRVLCVPLGAGMTFFSGHSHDYPMCQYSPVEFSGKYTSEYFMKCLRENPPDVIVKSEWPMTSWGNRYFGEDYCQEEWNWMLAHYRRYTAIGPNQFIKIYVSAGLNVPAPEALLELKSQLELSKSVVPAPELH
jgi:hypothetical protein